MDMPPSFEFAKEQTTQLITLSTAIIGVSVTFAKDIAPPTARRGCLYISWIVFLLSIVCGIATLGSLTGITARTEPLKAINVYDKSITSKSGYQCILFLIAVALLIIHAMLSGRVRASSNRSIAP
jgi:hypothetical protein